MDAVQVRTAALAASLGKWSRKLRAQGMPSDRSKRSQEDLADEAMISRTTLSGFERGGSSTGTRNPHLGVLVGVAHAFRLEVRDLVILAEAPLHEPIPSTIKRVASALSIPEVAVEAMRGQVAGSVAEIEGTGPYINPAPPVFGSDAAVDRETLGELAADLEALGRFSLSVAKRVGNAFSVENRLVQSSREISDAHAGGEHASD